MLAVGSCGGKANPLLVTRSAESAKYKKLVILILLGRRANADKVALNA